MSPLVYAQIHSYRQVLHYSLSSGECCYQRITSIDEPHNEIPLWWLFARGDNPGYSHYYSHKFLMAYCVVRDVGSTFVGGTSSNLRVTDML